MTEEGQREGRERESKGERIDRELMELLQELRVALPGVQVLFAFLLTVPFAQGFTAVTDFQRNLFFTVLCLTALSSAFLIGPSAWHRAHFRQRDKEHLLLTSNRLMIVGLAFLALAMIGAVVLIADYAFGGTLAVISLVAGLLVFGGLWAALPLRRRSATGG
jgi:hypothetical protein